MEREKEYTTKELTERFNVHRSTIHRAVASGRLKAEKRGYFVYFKESSVNEFLASSKR